MGRIKPEENFEPSVNTKRFWRFTRKTVTHFAGIKLPSLFDTKNFPLDFALFVCVLGLEAWGLINLLMVGGVSPLMFAFLFLLDVGLAIFRHKPEGTINELENRLVFETDPQEQERFKFQIGRAKGQARIFSVLIVCVAIFKIIEFWGLSGPFSGLTAGIVVSYLLTAYLQIQVTGYFLSGLLFNILFSRDRRQYLNAPEAETHPQHINQHREFVIAPETAEFLPRTIGKHELVKDGVNYLLRTWGVLEDSDLHVLVQAQKHETTQKAIAISGVKSQVQIMQTEPARIGPNLPPSVTRSVLGSPPVGPATIVTDANSAGANPEPVRQEQNGMRQ